MPSVYCYSRSNSWRLLRLSPFAAESRELVIAVTGTEIHDDDPKCDYDRHDDNGDQSPKPILVCKHRREESDAG
jgi:hypothetical protein